jgi:Delta3,5-Delta2,4-dienoyl-CoA isomerase
LYQAVESIGEDSDVRVLVVTGEGKGFTAGLDLTDIGLDLMSEPEDVARHAFKLKRHVTHMQEAFSALEKVPQPVIAAIHGYCIGAGLDLISACDMRMCTADTVFSIKEVAIGLAADLGTLQRLPRCVGNQSLFRELAYTGGCDPRLSLLNRRYA